MEWLKGQADLEGSEGVKDMVSECGKACCVTMLEAMLNSLVMRPLCVETEILKGLLE